MAAKRLIRFILLFLALLGVVWLLFYEPAEPSYQGKTLSQWFDQDRLRSDEQAQAIRAMGVKTVPFLLDRLEARNSPLKMKFYEWTRSSKFDDSRATGEQHDQALFGFSALGPIAKPAIPKLAKFLADSPEPHNEARALEDIGPDAIGVLTNALASPNAHVRDAAADALGRYAYNDATQGKVATQIIPALIGCAHDPDKSARTIACNALMSFGKSPDIAVPLLIPLIADKDTNARWFAVAALPAFASGAKSAVPALFDALHDPDQEIRERAVAALAWINPDDPAIAAVLMQNLHDADSQVRSHMISVLAFVGPRAQSFIPELLKALEDQDASIRIRAVTALRRISPQNPDVQAAIINSLGDKDPGVRNGASYAVGEIHTSAPSAISGLVKLINEDPDDDARKTAIESLARVDPNNPAGMSRLVRDLQDPDPARRDLAFATFGEIQGYPATKTAVPGLLDIIRNRSGEVSADAAIILHGIEPENPACLATLIKSLQDPDPAVRELAAKGLGNIGKPAHAAIPQLLKALKDSDEDVRGAAGWSIKRIDREAAANAGIK